MHHRSIYAVVSDLQCPAEHRDALSFVKHTIKTFVRKSDSLKIINIGDEVDFHPLSLKFAADPDGLSAGWEVKEAVHHLRDWYREFPETDVCVSNHTWRPYKKARAHGIPSQFMRDIKEVLEAPPGWHWKDRWIYAGMCFEHGENVSGPLAALNAAHQNHMNTIIGHQHTFGGVVHSGSISGQLWGLNTGCLIDIEHYAFAYGRTLRKKPTLGMGLIIDDIPMFVPMVLDKFKRWTGRLI